MESFTLDVEFSRSADDVLAAFWRLEQWPTVAPHVRNIEIVYEDPEVQVLWMTVASRGRTDRFKTVRVRQGDAIFYYQPRPPTFLRRHYGWWDVSVRDGRTVISSRHELELNMDAAALYLKDTGSSPRDEDEIRQLIVSLIRGNSLQTMQGLKRRMEQEGVANVQR